MVRSNGKPLAVSHFSAENKLDEAQRKTSNHGRSCQEIRCPHRSGDGQVFPGRTRETVSRRREDHRFREAENARQAFKISSNLFGSSPYPSARIDLTKSSSRGAANISRSTSISSFLCFLALASCGRRPRLFSSAITSRISSSFVPFAISEAGNDSGFLLTLQLSSLTNNCRRLTAENMPAYTVCSRWARNSARRASSHSACTASQSGLPAGISEICNRSGSL